MEEFAKMIYEQWSQDNDDRNVYFQKGKELHEELQEILSYKLSEKVYMEFCESCLEVEENAFIDGFAYACKCISNGRIEFGGADHE